jgi:pilus assembly protein CpaE
MVAARSTTDGSALTVAVVTADSELERLVRSTFADNSAVTLRVVNGLLADVGTPPEVVSATAIVLDVDSDRPQDIEALQRLAAKLGPAPQVVVVTQAVSANLARQLLQLRIADVLVKPVPAIELARACARISQAPVPEHGAEAQIFSFLPSAGGVGITTLAIQTAMILMNKDRRSTSTTCLVDLDLQHGSCADYLDLEPRLDLGEIEPRPDRLDRQLLEVMLSHHSSGLSVIAAPNKPAEMRSFDPDVVTRLLDLVSANFENVVIDLPRTWFPWTDSILSGSNRVFIVTETTVPGLRHARQLVQAICERLKGVAQPQIIVNRFEQSMFGAGLRRNDVAQALGPAFGGTVPNNYVLVREAIDRGISLEEIKPGNNVVQALKRIIIPPPAEKSAAAPSAAAAPKRQLFWAR